MLSTTFEYQIEEIDNDLLNIVLKEIKKDLRSQDVFDATILSNSIFFKGKARYTNVHPFNSIDSCEIVIDQEETSLIYRISYISLFPSTIILLILTSLLMFFTNAPWLFSCIVLFGFLCFSYFLSVQINLVHESYAESLLSLIEEVNNDRNKNQLN